MFRIADGIVFVAQIEMWHSIDLIPSLIDLIIFSLQVKKNQKSKVDRKVEKIDFFGLKNTDL